MQYTHTGRTGVSSLKSISNARTPIGNLAAYILQLLSESHTMQTG